MGNAASNASNNSQNHPRFNSNDSSSPSPNPNSTHRSLRTKKKSLELPDLASLSLTPSRGRSPNPPKSASIPIPSAPTDIRTRPSNPLPSSDLLLLTEPSTHLPFPPPSRTTPNTYFKGAPRPYNQAATAAAAASSHPRQQQQQAAHQRVQELYNQANQPQRSRGSSPVFIPETVHSSIPIALVKTQTPDLSADEKTCVKVELVPVKIQWNGGGKSVFLARAGDDDWKGRTVMDKESPTSSTYTITVSLPPGTHHIRFIVDDQWRVADDLPTAVDDQGSLANYVAVPLSFSSPTTGTAAGASTATTTLKPKPSTSPILPKPAPPPAQAAKPPLIPGQSFWSASSSNDDGPDDAIVPSTSSNAAAATHANHTTAAAASRSPPKSSAEHRFSQAANWTSVFPPELIEAAREEEAYILASSGQLSPDQGKYIVNGFVPAPNIPPAPGLPRYLDKLILNMRVAAPVVGGVGAVGGVSASGASGGVRGTRVVTGGAGGGESVRGIGGGVGAGRGGGNRAGGREGRGGRREREAHHSQQHRGDRDRERDHHRVDRERERERERRAIMSGVVPPPPSEIGDPSDVGEPGVANGEVMPLAPPVSISSSPLPHSALGSAAISPSTPTTDKEKASRLNLELDTSLPPVLTDDASVLPVPSHVVLHHLSTSAIKNGVLAVGNTIRYRQKYLTTIYYKPT